MHNITNKFSSLILGLTLSFTMGCTNSEKKDRTPDPEVSLDTTPEKPKPKTTPDVTDPHKDPKNENPDGTPIDKTTTTKAPAVTIEPTINGTNIDVVIKVTDEDSKLEEIKISATNTTRTISPLADIKDIDWGNSEDITNGKYIIQNANENAKYTIFVKAVDEKNNETVGSAEITYTKPVTSGIPASSTSSKETITQADIDALNQFKDDLCTENSEAVKHPSSTKILELCNFEFSLEKQEWKDIWLNEEATKGKPTAWIDWNSINLPGFQIQNIPESIGAITNLESLYLEENKINEIPNIIWTLKKLKEIRFYNNSLTSISPEIKKLSNLKELFLGNNKIKTIPNEIWSLTTLEWLDLDGFKFNTIPDGLWNLTNLKTIYLQSTTFKTVPDNIEKFINLESLWLSNNTNLTTISPRISSLKNLKEINVNSCPKLSKTTKALLHKMEKENRNLKITWK